MADIHNEPQPRNERRVADIIDAHIARALPPFDPKNELRAPLKRGSRGRYRHAVEVEALRAPFVDDALAGVPNRLIAERSGLSAKQVHIWRTGRRIVGRHGRAPAALGTKFLVSSLLGEPTTPVPHSFSKVAGAWRPPAYALRRPLDFQLFARMVGRLKDEFTIEEIALGIGIEERDIAMAIILDEARGAL